MGDQHDGCSSSRGGSRALLDEKGERGPRGARARVLVIDDNVDAADMLREALELCGHEVRIAHSGPDGLALARRAPPHVLVCDLGLPGLDGFGVARAFRAEVALCRTFLVALSGYDLPDHRRRAREAGFDRHLAKPPQVSKLDALILSAAAQEAEPAG